MPYNNASIPPTEEITGQTLLPCTVLLFLSPTFTKQILVARVKKILAVDEEISAVSANATYAITIATVSQYQWVKGPPLIETFQELFIRHFAEQAFNVMKAEKKPRRQMQYVDIGKTKLSSALVISIEQSIQQTPSAASIIYPFWKISCQRQPRLGNIDIEEADQQQRTKLLRCLMAKRS